MCQGVSVFEDEDEALVDAALAGDVFTFIRNCIVASADFHREVGDSIALLPMFAPNYIGLYIKCVSTTVFLPRNELLPYFMQHGATYVT